MNTKVAFVLLAVAIVGIAECKPNLRARMIEKAAASKRGGDEWPFGWFEYASLVGKCVAALNWLEFLEMDPPSEGILAEACPKAIGLAESMKDASEEDEKKLDMVMKAMFPLLQCVNVQAEREEVMVAETLNGRDGADNIFVKETEELVDACMKVYESAKEEEKKFEEGLKEMSGSKRSQVLGMLERFLTTKKR